MTDAVARTIRKTGVTVNLRPFNTIREHLVDPKDKVAKEDQAGVVYKIDCNCCEASYVGETERKLCKRVSEHHRESSPVGHHERFNQHKFSQSDVSILHRESDWFKRGVAEAIHIEEEQPTLNRGRERHTLPAIYRELLSKSRENNNSTSHVTSEPRRN